MEDKLRKKFAISRTCQNSLSFITKEAEKALLEKEQPKEVINLIKLIYLVLCEETEGLEGNSLLVNLYENIYPKYKVDTMRKSE